MGKCQHTLYLINNSCSQPNVNMETTKWNVCHNLVSNLMACPDKAHHQQQGIFGSPPPRRSGNSPWEEGDSKTVKMNLLLEDSKLQNDNQNNYQVKPSKENSGKKYDQSIQSISNHLRDMHLNPIIVCESIEEGNSSLASSRKQDELLKLSVPSVDISNEKKRPPMAATKMH